MEIIPPIIPPIIPTKIFIIPYRNRKQDKKLFDKHMKYILEDIPASLYKIFFVHQNDTKPFNRGAMKNIGFLAMRTQYPDNYKDITFIFNDIDTYPVNKNALDYDTVHGTVKHFYGFTFALGGIFAITGHDFEVCGGFPNYWGWGLEDAVIQKAVLAAKITINRDNFFAFRDTKNIVQHDNIEQRLTTKREPWRFVNDEINETYHDIQNLQYDIDNKFGHQKNVKDVKDVKNAKDVIEKHGKNLGHRDMQFGMFNKTRILRQKSRISMIF